MSPCCFPSTFARTRVSNIYQITITDYVQYKTLTVQHSCMDRERTIVRVHVTNLGGNVKNKSFRNVKRREIRLSSQNAREVGKNAIVKLRHLIIYSVTGWNIHIQYLHEYTCTVLYMHSIRIHTYGVCVQVVK